MAVNSEALLQLLGRPGKFQIFLFFLLCTNYTVMVFNNINMALFGFKNPHHCRLPDNVSRDDVTPMIRKGGKLVLDSCHVYRDFDPLTNETVTCPDGYVHMTSPGEVTVVSEFDLVCDRAYMASLSTTIYFVGVMIGGILFGHLADMFGRRPVLLFCLWSQMTLGVILSLMHNFIAFIVIRFMMGFVLQGMQAITVAMTMEFSQIRYRTVAGASLEVFWAIGIIYFSFISYMVRDWHYIQLILSLHSLVTISYFWILPESIRWLSTARKPDMIKSTMKKLAKFNCTRVDMDLVDNYVRENDNAPPQKKYSCLDLLKTPVLRRRTMILCYVWLSCMVGYYGLTLSELRLTESKYLNMFISGAVELPAYVSSMYVLSKFGRRIPFCVFQISGGLICIIAGAIPRTTETLVNASAIAALIGKFALVGGFSVAFMYTGELYPTVVRTNGVGTTVFFARLGGVLAPQVNFLTGHHTQIPVFIFGVMITLSGTLSLLLPETLNKKLPDTVEEVEMREEEKGKEMMNGANDNPTLTASTQDTSQA